MLPYQYLMYVKKTSGLYFNKQCHSFFNTGLRSAEHRCGSLNPLSKYFKVPSNSNNSSSTVASQTSCMKAGGKTIKKESK